MTCLPSPTPDILAKTYRSAGVYDQRVRTCKFSVITWLSEPLRYWIRSSSITIVHPAENFISTIYVSLSTTATLQFAVLLTDMRLRNTNRRSYIMLVANFRITFLSEF